MSVGNGEHCGRNPPRFGWLPAGSFDGCVSRCGADKGHDCVKTVWWWSLHRFPPAAVWRARRFGLVASGIEEISATLERWRTVPEELISCQDRASVWAAETLGGVWPPVAAAQQIITLVEKQRESE